MGWVCAVATGVCAFACAVWCALAVFCAVMASKRREKRMTRALFALASAMTACAIPFMVEIAKPVSYTHLTLPTN